MVKHLWFFQNKMLPINEHLHMRLSVVVEKEDALYLFMRRVNDWFVEPEQLALFRSMYKRNIDDWYFKNVELDVNVIVDNDCCNECVVIRKGDEDYVLLSELYNEFGLGVDLYGHGYRGCIEAAVDGCFLVRYYD